MKARLLTIVLFVVVLSSLTAYGQMIKRTDAIWARNATGTITLDGKLNEPEWAVAESINVVYKQDGRIQMPGSGWYAEGGLSQTGVPTDPTNATIKFLAKGDSLFVAFIVRDKSIGGGGWGTFDALLMNLHNARPTGFNPAYRSWNMSQSGEYFYGWVKEDWADTNMAKPGSLPGFFGWLGADGNPLVTYSPRTDSAKNIWNAATVVHGIQNNDTGDDTSWVTEVKFNTKFAGYNITNVGGDVLAWNVDIFDADYNWPRDTSVASKFSDTRTWVQGPWGNGANYGHLNIRVNPTVTTSGAVPAITADLTIPGAGTFGQITFDGKLDEPIWAHAPSFQLQYGNDAMRAAYPVSARYRSGQEQGTVNGSVQTPLDPNLATVKYFYRADTLFLGFDVNDQCVQSVEGNTDRWDGFAVSINLRDTLQGDNVLDGRTLNFIVSPSGGALLENFSFRDSARAFVKLALKVGTTVDTVGNPVDAGYTAEMKLVLTKFGYPAGRGDGVVFLGVEHYDGDTWGAPLNNATGTRTWFMRKGFGDDGPAWAYMDPAAVVTDVKGAAAGTPDQFRLLGNYPNPFNPTTTIKFEVAQQSEITLEVFNILGQRLFAKSLGVRQPGEHAVPFDATGIASGTYFYRLKAVGGNATLLGKMLLLK